MKKAILVVMTVIAAGCSNPKDTVIPSQIEKMDSLKPALEKLTYEEKELFAGYVMRHTVGAKMGGMFGIKEEPIPEGMTLGKAIEEQRTALANLKAKEAEQKALKEKLLAEQEKAIGIMREAVTVTLVNKKLSEERGYSGIVTDERLLVKFGYKNNTEKDIAGVKGTVDIEDLFGDHLVGFNISNDDTIKAGGTATWSGGRSVRYSMNDSKDKKFASLEDDKYKVIWKPKIVVFSDGTKMTAPDKPH